MSAWSPPRACRAFLPVLPALALAAACSRSDDSSADPEPPAFVAVDALDPDRLAGAWASAAGDCAAPDFQLRRDAASAREGLAVAARFNGWDRTGRLHLDGDPAIRFPDPERRLPVRLQGGGLHIAPPSDGLAVLGSRNLFAGGVLFRKCAERG